MSSKLHMCGVMRVVLLALMISSWAGWVSAEEPKKEGTGDVKERAVPQQNLAPTTEGVIIQGNQLRAMPGYKLQVGPNNTVSAMRPGGGLGFSGTCACVGTGGCVEIQKPDSVACSTDSTTTCDGTCRFVDIGKSLGIAPIMRRGIEGDQPAEPTPGTPTAPEQPTGTK